MVVIEKPVARYRRLAIQWFDFELTHQEKSALLQAFPKVYDLLKQEISTLTLQVDKQPKGKECVVDTLALLFVNTLGETDQLRVKHDQELPKHHLQAELDDFLRQVKIACLRSRHTPAFKT